MGAIDEAIRELRRWQNCPACARPVQGERCAACGLVLAGEGVQALIRQSEAAARALEHRQYILGQLIASAGRAGVPANPQLNPDAAVRTATAQRPASTRVEPLSDSDARTPTVGAAGPGGVPAAQVPTAPGVVVQGAAAEGVVGPGTVFRRPMGPGITAQRPTGPGFVAQTPSGPGTPAQGPMIPGVPPAHPSPSPAATPRPAAPVARPPRPEVNPVAVFSAVGVGALVAAALVLAFLVPADPGLVRLILVAMTVVSAAATLLLRQRRPVSAAAIATGTTALTLLVIALFVRSLPPDNALLAAAAATGGLALGLGVAGFALRLRPWVSSGILLAPIAAALAAWSFLRDEDALWGVGSFLMIGTALAAIGRWAARRWQGDAEGPLPFVAERQLLALGAALALLAGLSVSFALAAQSDTAAPLAAVLVLAGAVSAWLHGTDAESGWRRASGMLTVLAPVAFVLGLGGDGLLACAAAGLGWLVLAGLSAAPQLREGLWSGLLKGGWLAVLLLALPGLGRLLVGLGEGPGLRFTGESHVRVLISGWELPEAGYAVVTLLIAAAVCAVTTALPTQRLNRPTTQPTTQPPGQSTALRASHWLWPWLGLAGLAAAAALPIVPLEWSVALLLVLALAGGLAAWRVAGSVRPVQSAARVGGGLLIVAATAASWDSRELTLIAGAAAVVLTLGWTRLVPPSGRPVLVGLGYGYALALLGFALHWYPFGWAAGEWSPVAGLLAVAASAVSLAVLAATPSLVGSEVTAPARGLSTPSAFTVLGLGLVPWLLAVLTVLEDRTWWAAAAAASMVAVGLAVTARKRPQPSWLRVLAAASLLPTVGIVLINAGARVIPSSGSPILLPIVAALAAFTAITAAHWAGRVAGIDARAAAPIRRSFEWGALITAVAAVVLAIVLPASGAQTTLVVCAILAAGASVVATQPDRRRVVWLAALATFGTLWSALVLLDVGLVEAYTLPVGATGIVAGLILARRPARWWTLVTAGLQLGLLPTWLLAALGRDLMLRAGVLTGVALVLAALIPLVRRRFLDTPAPWVLASGLLVTGTAPLLVAVRSTGWAPSADPLLESVLAGMGGLAGFGWVIVLTAISAVLLGVAGQLVRWAAASSTRWRRPAASWRFAPALTVAALGPVLAVRPAPGVVLAMWLACLVFLGLTVFSTLLRLRGRVILPPVWYSWLLALAVGIAGWSLRELRVEFHALPLGLTLLACGVLAWRAAEREKPLPDRSWPIGQANPTWAILPGVLATLGPSTLAIGTDPQTWRAILVLVMALAALLVGARKLWRPCMVAGIVDLAVAVVLVFVARRGSIDAIPWLIALVSAGGVLLGLAVYSERRQHADRSTQ